VSHGPWMHDVHDEERHMADLPPYPDAHIDDDAGAGPDRRSTNSTPRWASVVKVVVAIVVVLLIAVLHLTGTLGPGLH
jgi:hypothetical protein